MAINLRFHKYYVRPLLQEMIGPLTKKEVFGCYCLLVNVLLLMVMAFLGSLLAEEMAMTRKYGFIAWLMSTSVGLLLSFLSKSSMLLGLSLTVPLMVARLSFAIPIWIRNGYQFKVSQVLRAATPAGNDRPPEKMEVIKWRASVRANVILFLLIFPPLLGSVAGVDKQDYFNDTREVASGPDAYQHNYYETRSNETSFNETREVASGPDAYQHNYYETRSNETRSNETSFNETREVPSSPNACEHN